MQVFLETGPEKVEAKTTVYRAPGKRPRDYRQMDVKTASQGSNPRYSSWL